MLSECGMQEARRTRRLAACRAVLEQRPEGEEGLFSTLWGQPALPLRRTPGRLLNLSLRVRAHSAAAWGPRAAAPCAALWWLHFPPGFQPRPCLLLCHPLVSLRLCLSPCALRLFYLLTPSVCLSVCHDFCLRLRFLVLLPPFISVTCCSSENRGRPSLRIGKPGLSPECPAPHTPAWSW